MNHLEYEWNSPVMGPMLARFAGATRLVRFDQRGNGLSDWEVDSFSEEVMVADMRAVADAARLDRFALLGISQGAAFAIRYAIAYPERVACLVLLGGFARGRRRRPDAEQKSLYETLRAMVRDGWGSPNPVFHHFFTSSFIPDAPPAAQAKFDELQRISTNAQNALSIFEMNSDVDVTELAKGVTTPTIIFHSVGDRVAPLEEGRRLARSIPNSDIVELPGDNHILMEGTEGFDRFFEEAIPFMHRHAGPVPASADAAG
jgi:pimeloyl-ACP methyl ester carboxylesterase